MLQRDVNKTGGGAASVEVIFVIRKPKDVYTEGMAAYARTTLKGQIVREVANIDDMAVEAAAIAKTGTKISKLSIVGHGQTSIGGVGMTPAGEPQAGVLGSDLVTHGAVLDLDLARGSLSWYQPARPIPPGAIVLPIEYRNGWLVASGINVNGRDVKLVVDTGASNIILIDTVPRAGEVREDTVDGTASAITLFHGDGAITFAGDIARHVPVDRSDSFPTLEGLIANLGGDVAGLLGLTSLGRERIIISRESLVLVLPPVSPSPL